jgi:hypothetical protein
MPSIYPVFTNVNGVSPVSRGFVCTEASGTSNPLATYLDSLLVTPNANPIQLNNSGRAVSGTTLIPIFLTAAQYRITLYAAGTGNLCNGEDVGSLIWQRDNVYDLAQLLIAGLISPVTFNVVNVKNLNAVRKCDQFAGADAGAKINACMVDLPSTGGIADASGIILGTVSTAITNSKSNVTLILPPSLTATAGISNSGDGFCVQGPGAQQSSLITYGPGSTGSFIKFANGGSEIFFGCIKNIEILGTNNFKKIGIELVDTSNIHIENVYTNLSGSTNNNEGIKLEGRESTYLLGNYVQADIPLHVADNPNSTIDCDFLSLINNEWIGPTSGTPAATIQIDTGVNITRWTAVHNAIIGGAGVQQIDTTTSQTSDMMTWIDTECEQQPVATSYCFDIERNSVLYGLRIEGLRVNASIRGVKLRTVFTAALADHIYDGTGVAYDIDSSVNDLSTDNVRATSGSATITIAAVHWNGCILKNVTKTCQSETLTVTGGIVGTTTNDDAAVGIVGEFKDSTLASGSAVVLASGSASSITTLTLTAGDWEVWGVAQYGAAGTTSVTDFIQGSGKSGGAGNCDVAPAAAFGVPGAYTADGQPAEIPTAIEIAKGFPPFRYSLSGTTKVCLIVKPSFTASSLTGYGYLAARRVR